MPMRSRAVINRYLNVTSPFDPSQEIVDNDFESVLRLCECILRNDKTSLRSLVLSVDVNATHSGRSPLMLAALIPENEGLTAAELLLKAGANPKFFDETGESAMHCAAQQDNHSVIQLLHSACPELLNSVSKVNETPLLQAAACGSVLAVKCLVMLGADVTIVNEMGETAEKLVRDCHTWREFVTARLETQNSVISYDKTRFQSDCEKMTEEQKRILLCSLCQSGDLDGVTHLLRLGVDPDARVNSLTPLMLAASCGKRSSAGIVKQLMQAGSNCQATDLHGMTGVHWAALAGANRVMRILVPAMQQAVHQVNDWGDSLLLLAVVSGSAETVRILLDSGADSRISNFRGVTPSQLAWQLERWKIYLLVWLNEQERLKEEKDAAKSDKIDESDK